MGILVLLSNKSIAQEHKYVPEIRHSIEQTSKFLKKISIGGGFRGIYSADLKEQWGSILSEKDKSQDSSITIEFVTPAIGKVFIDLYLITKNSEYIPLIDGVALALKNAQLTYGGWSYWGYIGRDRSRIKTTGSYKWVNYCALDDDISTGAIDFFLSYKYVFKSNRFDDVLFKGLDFLVASQYPNGAWPSWYPLQQNYTSYYTFNDGVINNCVEVLERAYIYTKDNKFLNCIEKAGDFIIRSQLPAPQAGWAQHYDQNMHPAKGRSHEVPAVCSEVTGNNIYTLLRIYNITKKSKYILPIPPAIEWLERSRLPNRKWSRFYEFKTNKPFISDRKSNIHYDLTKIPSDVKGYAWIGIFKIEFATHLYNLEKSQPRQFQEALKKCLRNPYGRWTVESIDSQVGKALASQKSDGSWRVDGYVYLKEIVKNLNVFNEYLKR